MTIDISTGDAITPHPVLFSFREMFSPVNHFELLAYNVETVLAEKVETILRRSVFNTRPRDFYDTYILAVTQPFDRMVFAQALSATARHRATTKQICDTTGILQALAGSKELRAMWDKYQKQFSYAAGIEFDAVLRVIESLLSGISL